MPFAASVRLAPHFTAGELGGDDPTLSAAGMANLAYTAAVLERFREVLGVPLRVTSGYRSPAHNAEVGGAATSVHPQGLAADVVPVGMSQYAAWTKLRAAAARGELPPFDQVIAYPVEGHFHIGVGPQHRGEWRIKAVEGNLATATDALAARLRGYVPEGVAGVLAVLVLALVLLLYLPGVP